MCKLRLFALVLCYSGLEAFLTSPKGNSEPVAETNCGKVRGIWLPNNGAMSFRGIPYASPPIGNLRWRPPKQTKKENGNCWQGTYKAYRFGSPCVQRGDEANTSNVIGDEDCLYLNVFTPTLNSTANLSVMFWIHGGYLTIGNGNLNDQGYAPTPELARSLNVVFVSINYRLQAFGFMALEWLRNGSPTNTSGNYGFMDQIAALQWVQENINQFGGDPKKVTVFGQSSGGTSIFALLASPLCKSLFSKAWMLSASPILNKTATQAFEDNLVFVNNTGCSDVNCLYQLSAADVTQSVPWDEFPYWGMEDQLSLPQKGRFDGALAIIDGYVLLESPFHAWVHGRGNDVPVMIGTTAQETDISPSPSEVTTWSWNSDVGNYTNLVNEILGPYGDVVSQLALRLYPINVSTPEFQLTSMVSDIRLNCGNDYLSIILAGSFKSPVYRYVATYYSTTKLVYPFGSPLAVRYAFHAIDILGFYQTMHTVYHEGVSEQDISWENNVQREVMSFVLTGHPDSPTWTTYPEVTAELDVTTTVSRGYHPTQCQFWLANGFFSYSVIN